MRTATLGRRPSRREKRSTTPPVSYIALCREWPLRPIRSEADYDRAVSVLEHLVVRSEGDLDAGERDYLEMLELVIERYDDEHYLVPSGGTPLEHLKFLMEQNNMKTIDLGKLIGNRGLASLIVNGKRQLSKGHIRVLADHFKVEPGLFL